MEYTISITKVQQHIKLIDSTAKVNALITNLKKLADAEKVSTGEIAFKNESLTFISDLQAAIDNYKLASSITEDVTYTDEEITPLIEEYKSLVDEIAVLQADGDINNLEDVSLYKTKVARKNELKDIRDKLIAVGWTMP